MENRSTAFPEQLKAKFVGQSFIGQGLRKIVFRAFDLQFSRWVAVKVLQTRNAEQLLDELRPALKSTKHPNLVEVYDFGLLDVTDGKVVYLVEELLDDTLSKVAPVNDAQVLVRYLLGIARGLEHLHSKGVVHRDVKPDNCGILRGVPKLFDFGTLSSASHPSLIFGAPHTRAPEVFLGEIERFGSELDIWAFGCTGYFLTRASYPFILDREIAQHSQYASIIWRDATGNAVGAKRALKEIEGKVVKRIGDFWKKPKRLLGKLGGVGAIITECWKQKPSARLRASQLVSELDKLHRALSAGEAVRREDYLVARAQYLTQYAANIRDDPAFAAALKREVAREMKRMAEVLRDAGVSGDAGGKLLHEAEQLAET